MTRPAPPLRFLALVLGGWVVMRGTFLATEWLGAEEEPGLPKPIVASAGASPISPPVGAAASVLSVALARRSTETYAAVAVRRKPGLLAPKLAAAAMAAPRESSIPSAAAADAPAAQAVPGPGPLAATQPGPAGSRWSASAWLFLRGGGDPDGQLAPGGTLGGSQVGARLGYRLGGAGAPLALSARLYSPTRAVAAAEAAAGIDWQPVPAVPLRLLAERRQALGRDGRSAFALMAYGGVSDRPVGPLRLESYAQAGVVGVRSRDLFIDGSARLLAPIPSAPAASAGGGLWGAAQPGVARLDAGPVASVRVAPHLRAVADWRFRLAGDAAPGSGPSLTLAADF